MQTKAVRLVVPARDDMMLVVRLTTSGVLARANLTLDASDDVKMAVEEAAACLIRFSQCSSVQLDYEISDSALQIALSSENCQHCLGQQTPDELGTIRYILQSMVDEVRLSGNESALTSIVLTKQLAR